MSDIVNNRHEQFCFKNTEFLKRNWHWLYHKVLHPVGHKLHHVWEELVKVGQGLKLLTEDFKFLVL